MHMKGGLFHRFREWMLDHAYWVTLGAVLTVIAASALYTRGLERQAADVQAAAHAPEIAETATPEPETTLMPLATLAPLSLYSMLKPGGTTVRPVSGGVIRGFDSETPVLWEALSCVQLHAAVDLAGEAGGGGTLRDGRNGVWNRARRAVGLARRRRADGRTAGGLCGTCGLRRLSGSERHPGTDDRHAA